MEFLSDRIQRLSESQTLAMSRQSRELRNKGIDIVNLSLGEPDFDTPNFIKTAAKQAIDDNYTKYMAVNGYEDFREAISKKFLRDNALHYSANQIVVSTGAKQSISNVVMSLIDEGDEVIIPAPFWVTYIEIVKMANGIPVVISTDMENDFKITPEQLEASITSKTRLIMFSTPCNPTGSVYSENELRALAKVIAKHDNLCVISDEIYEHINFEGKHFSLATIDSMYDRTITVNGVSKSFAMTGWRLGYIGAPQWIADACTKLQGQVTSGTCGISQRAAMAAVLADPSVTHDMLVAFKSRRDLMVSGLSKIQGMKINNPMGAFYIFPDVSSFIGKSFNNTVIKDATDLCMYLLHEGKVAVVTGDAFGSPGYLRISYAASEENLYKAIDRINVALQKLI